MRKTSLHKKLLVGLAVFALAVAGLALTSSSVLAGKPKPPLLCGFTAQWDCTMKNGKHKTVIGTQCDIARFEKRNGATCVPF